MTIFENSSIKLTNNVSYINYILIFLKALALVLTLIWFILMLLVKSRISKDDEDNVDIKEDNYYFNLNKLLNLFDYFVFSIVILLIFIYSLVVLYVFRHNAWYIFTQIISKEKLKNVFGISEYKEFSLVPRLHVSLFWWVNIWIIMMCGLSIISKITKDVKWILMAF